MKDEVKRTRLAALLGFLAVGLGASGAHGPVHDALLAQGSLKNWETAVDYHLVHAVVLLVVANHGVRLSKWAGAVWLLQFFGVLLFSGSLYVLSLSGLKWLGAVTPLGGLCLMAGWLLLAVGAVRRSSASTPV